MSGAGGYDEYEFIADLYDFVRPYRDRQDVAFFVDAAKESGRPVLEVGCGTGRVLIPTARAGVDIVGLDLSPHMLAVCRERLGHEALIGLQREARVDDVEVGVEDRPGREGHARTLARRRTWQAGGPMATPRDIHG